MKTSLAIIDEAVATALEKPAGETKTQYVAGFPVETTTIPHRRWDERRNSFREDAERLRAALADQGVQPVAMLPAQWWQTMIERSDLIDLAPDAQGRVTLNATSVAEKADKNVWTPITMIAAITLAVSSVVYYLFVIRAGLYPFNFVRNALIVGLSGVGGTLLSTLLFGVIFEKTGAWLESQVAATLWMLSHSRASVVREMQEFRHGEEVRVYLPTPPESVVEVLKRCAGMNLRVAAVSGAVGFSKEPRTMIAEHLRKTKTEAIERAREMRQLDPIVYAQRGSAVAIIAQFGAFPIEQKLVEEIVKSGNLLG